MPDFDLPDFAAAAGGRFAPFALSVPAFDESPTTLARFADITGIDYPLLDHAGTLHRFDRPPGISPYPFDVVVSPDGAVLDVATRYHRLLLLRAMAEWWSRQER